MSGEILLEVRGLKTVFETGEGVVRAVDGVSFSVPRGGTLGLVGESGCGKSVTALSLLRLVSPPGRIASGAVLLEGKDLMTLSDEEIRQVRGGRIAMVFQEPMTSLNPVFTIGNQIEEAIAVHRDLSRSARKGRVRELLQMVGIPDPDRAVRGYPHEFSGGMRQRAMIAMALACEPDLLIADEPTTALDVTIQAQVLALLRDLRDRLRMALILITHDLAIVAENVERVAVMYAGKIVEEASTAALFEHPRHPYTRALLSCLPERRGGGRLGAIPGSVPDLAHLPRGCAYQDRCDRVGERCRVEDPELEGQAPAHRARCFFPC